MPSIKSTPTLLSVSDAFETTLRALLTGFTTSQAISICQRIQDMVLCAHLWITDRSTDAGGEQVVRIAPAGIELMVPVYTQTDPLHVRHPSCTQDPTEDDANLVPSSFPSTRSQRHLTS